jgi:hypothetical protein
MRDVIDVSNKPLKRFAFNLRHIQQPEGSSSILAD